MLRHIKRLFDIIANIFLKYNSTLMFFILCLGAVFIYSQYKFSKEFFLLSSCYVVFMLIVYYSIHKLKNYKNKYQVNLKKAEETSSKLEQEIQEKKKLAYELIKTNQKQWELAFYDKVTGLPNRSLLEDRMKKLIFQCVRRKEKFGVLFLDLDGFKNINDSLGHTIGDKYLKEVAKKIKSVLRNTDTLARLGGDEFIIIAENLKDNSELSKVAHKILTAVRDPVYINNIEIFTTVSIGMVVYPADATKVPDLIMKADLAMYRAKDLGKNKYCFYSGKLQEDADKNFIIISDINKALQNNEMKVFYQPQIDITNNKVIGVEALSRWKHNKLGFVEPEKFINIAESLGLINELDNSVFQTACNDYQLWENSLGYPIKLSLNVSISEVYNHDFIENIIKQIEKFQITNFNVELELTESVLIKDIEKVQDILSKLSRHSIRLAIDDFGTGYSTFKYLSIFPISAIKIDKSFVQNFLKEDQSLFIIKAILNLSNLLGIDTIAEGVETREQLDKLKELGCKYCQGYYFCKPIPQEQFLKYLINHNLKK